MKLEELKAKFLQTYGQMAQAGFFAPGRINLIGEHTDYNGGFVFPCAISFGNYCLVRRTDQAVIKLRSLNMSFEADIPLSELSMAISNEWVNYVIGVFAQFISRGLQITHGLEMLYYGDVPPGAGLSSSAAIEVVTAVAINTLFGFGIDGQSLALMCQKAEHDFAGVHCGIMDQFASAMSKQGHALFLNCDSLDYQLVPLELGDHKIVISNTNSPHKLDSGKYNERVAECRQAVTEMQKGKKFSFLAELDPDEFSTLEHLISDEKVRRRALHVVEETARTKDAVDALIKGDLSRFGKLMTASHKSLKENYEVTGFELDTMNEEALKNVGVLGSRMTGGGFGGCTVSIVHKDAMANFIENTGKNYRQKTGLTPQFYIAETQDGGKQIF
ncbi:MAG: galactokinase [Bacteroidales bacterium]|nr:galactokinase [Bacteroidales bacterium]